MRATPTCYVSASTGVPASDLALSRVRLARSGQGGPATGSDHTTVIWPGVPMATLGVNRF
jgi:hypothetical protein